MDLHAFIQEYTDAVYHGRDADAAGRFIADPCIRHEHGHRVVMTLAENRERVASFLAQATDLRFENAAALAEGDLYASAYQFTYISGSEPHARSGIEIFRVSGGKIVETWNAAIGDGAWG